jgi:hypothetical protein
MVVNARTVSNVERVTRSGNFSETRSELKIMTLLYCATVQSGFVGTTRCEYYRGLNVRPHNRS